MTQSELHEKIKQELSRMLDELNVNEVELSDRDEYNIFEGKDYG